MYLFSFLFKINIYFQGAQKKVHSFVLGEMFCSYPLGGLAS